MLKRCIVIVTAGSWLLLSAVTPLIAGDVGQVSIFLSSVCPLGWQPVDNSYISSTTELGAFLKSAGWPSQYGQGSYYRLPDLRDKFVRGFSASSGRQFGEIQQDAFQGHYHGFNEVITPYLRATQAGIDNAYENIPYPTIALTITAPITDGTNGTPRTAAETRPINVGLQYCVKSISTPEAVMSSSVTLVDVSSGALAALNPGIWQYFNGGDLSFWLGILVGCIIIVGYKVGAAS